MNGLGSAGGHDKRAGGAIILAKHPDETHEDLLRSISAGSSITSTSTSSKAAV